MTQRLTIVAYHYVRDLARSRYPAIKARDLSEFRRQLDHVAANYTVVTAEMVMGAILGETVLPSNACWLTFDDGYLDHYASVFPLLNERGWQGSFFAPALTVADRVLLDVNKIHLVLAAAPSAASIVREIRSVLDDRGRSMGLAPFEEYWKEYGKASRYDGEEVTFVKRFLQRGLIGETRAGLCDLLLDHFVGVDQGVLAAELYATEDQLRTMMRAGMYVGSHGYSHQWLDSLQEQDQAKEIDRSVQFLAHIGAPTDRWVMCYPYGSYNEATVALLADRGCVAGITVVPKICEIGRDMPLALPRLDTNDLPI
jgi:peptidoglycan/xylan/chitin deacetylase (PgdA/CDA1 family)